MKISCELHGGTVYGLISDYGCGSWGLASCIAGRYPIEAAGAVFLNNTQTDRSELLAQSCFISEQIQPGVNEHNAMLSVKQCIEMALETSGLPYSCAEIKEMFSLTDERFHRDMQHVSGEIWNISTAVGFAANKQVFCLPWLNERDLFRARVMHDLGIFDLLRKQDKIVLIPTSHKKEIKRYCDVQILFTEKGYVVKKA